MFVRWPQLPQNLWSVAKSAPQLRHASATQRADLQGIRNVEAGPDAAGGVRH
jgi:hypothetical protein